MKIFEQHSDHVSLVNIKKYLNGQMSNEEMHVFERHLLDCEFCNEAFEGYELSGQSIDSLAGLEQRIFNKTKDSRVPKLAIAASVIFLLCFSIVLTFSLWDNKEDEVAIARQPSEKVELTEKTENDIYAKESAVSEDVKPPIILQLEQSGEEIENIEQTDGKNDLESTSKSIILKTTQVPNPEKIVTKIDSFGADEKEQRILDELVIEEQVAIDEEDKITTTFDLASNDIVLKERAASTSSDVTNSNRSKALSSRNLADKNAILSSNTIKDFMVLNFTNAIPLGGLAKYKLYLKESLRYPEKARSDKIAGAVELSFQVTKDGELINFEIIKSLSEECDLEAKRMVLEGEKWTLIDKYLPEENNVVNLIVEFVLSD